jgi:IS4 transposase
MMSVEVRFERQWYRYLTSVTDPKILPAWVIADIYRHRWRIEEAFFIVKRVLNLSAILNLEYGYRYRRKG